METSLWNIPRLQKFIRRLPRPRQLKVLKREFEFCVVGGTFDRLHMGHKTLISTALAVSKRILLCITTDRYVRSLRKIAGNIIESYGERLRRVKTFLEMTNRLNDVIFCAIDDPFSPAVTSEYALILDSIVISADRPVVERTKKLNELRKKHGLPPLKIIQIPLILDPYGKVFSSTRYRINDYFPEPHPPEFRIKNELIKEIRKPKGTIVDSPCELPDPDDYMDSGIVAIGDAVFINLVKNNYPVSVAILDFRVRRQKLRYSILNDREVFLEAIPMIPAFNPPGTISTYSWFSVMVAFTQPTPTVLRVYGEEDLMGFPATILAPEGALIVYGDPFLNKIVYYTVDRRHKEKAIELLQRMERRSHGI